MQAASGYNISDNDLNLAVNGADVSGIQVFGGTEVELSCNDVISADINNIDANLNQSAIRVFGTSSSLDISCNTVDATYNGILFNGNANPTILEGNNINQHHFGLRLTQSAVIGQQDYTGNLWHTQNPVGAGGFNAIYEDITAANFFPIVVNQSTTVTGASPEAFGSVFPLIPNQPVDWIRAFNIEPNFECLATNACNDLPCNPCDSELDEDIAEGNIQNNPYTSETIWMLQSELYARLNRDSILLNSDSLYQAFYANMQNDNIAQFETINEELLDLYELDATVYTNLQNNNNSVEQLMSQLANKMEQMQDETLSTQQLAALQTEITGLQQNIANLIAYNNTAIELAQSSQTLTTANMEANNDAIVSSETIEVNTQEVNDIYLNTLAEGITEFSTSQENSLFSIANQCPLEGGAAVFMARSMYYLIDRTAHYDDRWLCLQEGIILREQNVDISSNNFNVYPNPANNELTVTYSIEEEETTIFELYDGIGKKLIRSTLDKNDNTIIIDVSNIKNGIYFYKIVSNNKNVKNGKIIISR